jgi:hypothetical protein
MVTRQARRSRSRGQPATKAGEALVDKGEPSPAAAGELKLPGDGRRERFAVGLGPVDQQDRRVGPKDCPRNTPDQPFATS